MSGQPRRHRRRRRRRRPYDRADLDSAAAHGCQEPGCENHGRRAHVLRLSSKCHPGAPMFMSSAPGVVTFRCVLPPFDVVAVVAGEARPAEGGTFDASNGTFTQGCHDSSAVTSSYQHDSGIVRVECHHCDALVAEVHVAAAEPGGTS